MDSVVSENEVVFANVSKYGKPPMNVAQGGGIFTTFTVPRGSADDSALRAINRDLIAALGLLRGVAHAEFIRAHADGHFYFLECAARVGGAYINEMVEAATGINLWREWARIEIAGGDGSYQLPPVREEYAGVILSLPRQEDPDTSAYNDPEVYLRIKRHHHAGLVCDRPIRSGFRACSKITPAASPKNSSPSNRRATSPLPEGQEIPR